MRLTELVVENFRAIESETFRALPPIAGIWGPNGCGKSAVLQSIVALKNLCKVGYGPDSNPAFNSDGLSLGTWDTVFFRGRTPGKRLRIEAKGDGGVRLASFSLTDLDVEFDKPSDSYFQSVRYFPTRRALTERSHPLGEYPSDGLGLNPDLMHSYLHWFLHDKMYERQRTGKPNEVDDVNRWMEEFGLGALSDRPSPGPPVQSTGMFTDKTTNYGAPLIDGGFGGNSMLPILLEAYSFKGGLLLIEEPEMSLHPGAQATLLDLFLEVARTRGHQVLFTSHSEYLLRRVARFHKENPTSTEIGGFEGRKDSKGAHFSPLSMDDLLKRWEGKHQDLLLGLHERP